MQLVYTRFLVLHQLLETWRLPLLVVVQFSISFQRVKLSERSSALEPLNAGYFHQRIQHCRHSYFGIEAISQQTCLIKMII